MSEAATRGPELHLYTSRFLEAIPVIAMTLAEAGQACGLSAGTMKRYIDDGTLRAKRTKEDAGRILVTPKALQAWYESLPDA